MIYKRIGIIGTGKLGSALAASLLSKGYLISGLYSIGGVSQSNLCKLLGLKLKNDIAQTVESSEVIFITVPDTQIGNVSLEISQNVGYNDIKNKIFYHMSGALTSDELISIHRVGGLTGSLHPIQSFTGISTDTDCFEGIYFGFEGSDEAKSFAQNVISQFNGKLINIDKNDKPIYHACCCILSNYLVTLSYTVEKLLNSICAEDKIDIKAFLPLLKGTLGNIEKYGALKSLTGPISRGDTAVIKGHIDAITQKNYEVKALYEVLGEATADLACIIGSIDNNTRMAISEIFNGNDNR
ncbi:MAG: DUF2520 domain-containing protein [Bacillota bacterium]|nr:DUF2520 domain-containing protein [Bacillota bacterium]